MQEMFKQILMRKVLVSSFVGLFILLTSGNAFAVPSFERQTGLKCMTCHTMFPELTPFGRTFKLGGYVLSKSSKSYEFPPPLAAMAQLSLTHTDKPQPHGFIENNWANISNSTRNDVAYLPQELSIFYAGRIYGKVGAFLQGTYDGASNELFLDMADVRYANNATLAGKNLIYGFTLNNAPTLQDVWNTAPAFSFPFAVSSAAPSPSASAIIEGALDQQVGGIGAYALWNNIIYGEVAVYHTTRDGITKPLGAGTHTDMVVDGAAPYWRLTLQRQWDEHSLSVGAFGIMASIFPEGKSVGKTDTFTTTALDAQYQYIGQKHMFSTHAVWIHEDQNRDASFATGITSHRSDFLDTVRIHCHYDYHDNFGMIGGSLGYFSTTGSRDELLYAPKQINGSRTGKPDSSGFILEADYLPKENLKLSLQYRIYDKFNGAHSNYDGSGRNSSDNNTLYALLWIMF